MEWFNFPAPSAPIPPPSDNAEKDLIHKIAETVASKDAAFLYMLMDQESKKSDTKCRFLWPNSPLYSYFAFKVWSYRNPVEYIEWQRSILMSAGGLNLSSFEPLLQALVKDCTKSHIQCARSWVFKNCSTAENAGFVLTYLEQETTKHATQFNDVLHILYLINDLLFYEMQKTDHSIMRESITPRIEFFLKVAYNAAANDTAKKEKIDKIVSIWSSKKIFGEATFEFPKKDQMLAMDVLKREPVRPMNFEITQSTQYFELPVCFLLPAVQARSQYYAAVPVKEYKVAQFDKAGDLKNVMIQYYNELEIEDQWINTHNPDIFKEDDSSTECKIIFNECGWTIGALDGFISDMQSKRRIPAINSSSDDSDSDSSSNSDNHSRYERKRYRSRSPSPRQWSPKPISQTNFANPEVFDAYRSSRSYTYNREPPKRRGGPAACFRCGKPGHIAKNCDDI